MNIALALCGSAFNLALFFLLLGFTAVIGGSRRSTAIPTGIARKIDLSITGLFMVTLAMPLVSTGVLWWMATSAIAIKHFWWAVVPDVIIPVASILMAWMVYLLSPSQQDGSAHDLWQGEV